MNVRLNKLPMEHFKGDLEKTSTEFLRVLYILAGLAIALQIPHDIAFAVKALLIFIVSVFVARETEIFFVTQKFGIMRPEAKETLATTKPEVTGLIFALLLPVGTPLFVVAAGSFVGIFIGKMVFGGYSFNVFNPAIVGRLFVGIAWPALVTNHFPDPATIDNYLIELIFNREFSTELLSPLMTLEANGIVTTSNIASIPQLLFSPGYGMLFSIPAIVYLVLIVFFAVRKTIDLKPLLLTTITSLITISVVAIGFKLDFSYILFHLLAGGFLFVTIFMMTDPFTKPYTTVGTLYYAGIFTVVFTLIRFIGQDADGVLYALLFANLFVPMLNKKTVEIPFGFNKKAITGTVVLLLVLVGTGLFINKVIDQRIESKEIVVSGYVEN